MRHPSAVEGVVATSHDALLAALVSEAGCDAGAMISSEDGGGGGGMCGDGRLRPGESCSTCGQRLRRVHGRRRRRGRSHRLGRRRRRRRRGTDPRSRVHRPGLRDLRHERRLEHRGRLRPQQHVEQRLLARRSTRVRTTTGTSSRIRPTTRRGQDVPERAPRLRRAANQLVQPAHEHVRRDEPHVGIYNVAYDLWLDGIAARGGAELMIWTEKFHQVPGGDVVAHVELGGVRWDVWKADWDWTYLAFVPESPLTSGRLDLLEMLTGSSGRDGCAQARRSIRSAMAWRSSRPKGTTRRHVHRLLDRRRHIAGRAAVLGAQRHRASGGPAAPVRGSEYDRRSWMRIGELVPRHVGGRRRSTRRGSESSRTRSQPASARRGDLARRSADPRGLVHRRPRDSDVLPRADAVPVRSRTTDVIDLPDDFRDLLVELHEAGAAFVVVGGHAVAFHGHPRATKDLDVLVRADPRNAARVYHALAAFGAPLEAFEVSAADFATYDGVLPRSASRLGASTSSIESTASRSRKPSRTARPSTSVAGQCQSSAWRRS